MDRYQQSQLQLNRAMRTIPLASQTFSKSITTYPLGAAPLFIKKGKGAYVWDVDDNQYVDFVNGLACVTLGYCDADVDAAVIEQLQSGVVFTLPHPLEAETAERLVRLIPCAEKVRFAKNGSDATSAAIRLARAFTGREHIAVCGYHGWQDWYIGSTTRDLGVPAAVKALTHRFNYNDLASLEQLFADFPNQIAAVILEPMNIVWPEAGFLEGVQQLAKKHGAVLIFDETITGFRFGLGGAQELFKVTPDLATFGKGLANGHPLSAVVGRADIMDLMTEIFFSGTFGGEALSLAAACAVMDKLERESVLTKLHATGEKLMAGVQQRIEAAGLAEVFSLSGHPTWSFINIKAAAGYSIWDIRTLFLQEMYRRGILTVGTHNLSYAHQQPELDKLFSAYEEVLALIADALSKQDIQQRLECKVLEPLFKVR